KHLDTGDFGTAWGGVSGLQVGLSAVWTEARRRGVPLEEVVAGLSSGPARVAGLPGKGPRVEGADAALAVFAADGAFTVSAAARGHRSPVSAYDGAELVGRVRRTFLRGVEVDGHSTDGRMIQRQDQPA